MSERPTKSQMQAHISTFTLSPNKNRSAPVPAEARLERTSDDSLPPNARNLDLDVDTFECLGADVDLDETGIDRLKGVV